jgi:hypothetical protein
MAAFARDVDGNHIYANMKLLADAGRSVTPGCRRKTRPGSRRTKFAARAD